MKKSLSLMLCLMTLLSALPAVYAESAVSDGMILLPGGTSLWEARRRSACGSRMKHSTK